VPAEPPRPPPDGGPVALPRSAWITLAAATGLALAAILLFPRSDGDAPPLASLALVGSVIAGVTAGALYAIVRRDVGLPSRLALSLSIAFGLVAIVKFVLGPLGLYEINAVRPLQEVVGTVADPVGAAITAVAVFGLYALVYTVVVRAVRHRSLAGGRSVRAVVVGLLVIGALAVTGIGLVVLVVLLAPIEYLSFVFASGAGVFVAAAILGAASLIGSVFRALGRRPELVADLGAVVTLFWLGLGFLALYHALWIVYLLVLGSIWPLRTVTPK
jgi:hypothetical protein